MIEGDGWFTRRRRGRFRPIIGPKAWIKMSQITVSVATILIKQPAVEVKFSCLGFRSKETLNHTRGPRMEWNGDGGKKAYAHYNHTDACKYSRWTARESYQFMYAKPWHHVVDFYAHLVNGRVSISSLFPATAKNEPREEYDVEIIPDPGGETRKPTSGRWARVTYKMLVAYHGTSFDGWQKQPNLNTVQGLVEKSLGNFLDERKAQLLKTKGLPLECCCVVAGRTDKGVSALQQVCAFSTWRTDVSDRDIVDSINNAAPGKLRLLSISQVSRVFHPNFSAKWRRYLYMLPYSDKKEVTDRKGSQSEVDGNMSGNRICQEIQFEQTHPMIEDITDENELGFKTKPTKFSVSRVDQLLRKLEGKMLSYRMFARDTKASRNIGPPTECFVYHARATEARLPFMEKDLGEDIKVMCVELVANRFLRKMVRVLVATSIREAAAGAEDDALLKLMDATCRRATAPPAPPEGLCLLDVGYSDFEPQICFIS